MMIIRKHHGRIVRLFTYNCTQYPQQLVYSRLLYSKIHCYNKKRFLTSNIDQNNEMELRKKRIRYRCKQRGMLELDLLMGTWVDEHIDDMSTSQIEELEVLSLMETPILLKYLLNAQKQPPDIQNNTVFRQLFEYTQHHKKSWN